MNSCSKSTNLLSPDSQPPTPYSLGFRMPAEWEPHASTWLSWPRNKTTWPGALLERTESIYLEMISALLLHEKVNLLVRDQETAGLILRILAIQKTKISNLVFHKVNTVDAWIRDYGPIFIKKKLGARSSEFGDKKNFPSPIPHLLTARNIAFTKWVFNAWGGKYSNLKKDDRVVDELDSLAKRKRFDPGIVLEGGSIDMNGRGSCLTTEQCLLNPNRNPSLSRKDIEQYLKDYLGAVNVIWLKAGIAGDDTDGHVDDITRFVNSRTVIIAKEDDPSDQNYAPLKENKEILKSARDSNSKRFRIIELPMPGRICSGNKRLPASYANFYIANKIVLVPVYNHKNDKLALKIIKSVFPGRKAIGIECTALVHGLGSIHCVTQQEPR